MSNGSVAFNVIKVKPYQYTTKNTNIITAIYLELCRVLR